MNTTPYNYDDDTPRTERVTLNLAYRSLEILLEAMRQQAGELPKGSPEVQVIKEAYDDVLGALNAWDTDTPWPLPDGYLEMQLARRARRQ